jgi:hypothetical protein
METHLYGKAVYTLASSRPIFCKKIVEQKTLIC